MMRRIFFNVFPFQIKRENFLDLSETIIYSMTAQITLVCSGLIQTPDSITVVYCWSKKQQEKIQCICRWIDQQVFLNEKFGMDSMLRFVNLLVLTRNSVFMKVVSVSIMSQSIGVDEKKKLIRINQVSFWLTVWVLF